MTGLLAGPMIRAGEGGRRVKPGRPRMIRVGPAGEAATVRRWPR